MLQIILCYLLYPFVRIAVILRRRRRVERILIVQTAKIGDLICATPVIHAMARHFPEARITVFANPVAQEVLDGNPDVDMVVPIPGGYVSGVVGKLRVIKLIRAGDYDIALTLNPNVHFAVGLFLGLVRQRLSVLPERAGWTFRMASRLFTHVVRHSDNRLLLDSYFALLCKIGVASAGYNAHVTGAPGADAKVMALLAGKIRPIVGIAITSGNKLKEVHATRIAGLVELLLQRGDLEVMLIGGPADRQSADSILATLRAPGQVIDVVGKFRLNEMPVALARLAVFVGVDSGLTFMADACGVPIVEIAGPGPIEEQRPLGRCIIIRRKLPCVPCLHIFRTVQTCRIGTRECIESVTVEEIYRAVDSLLTSGNGAQGHVSAT